MRKSLTVIFISVIMTPLFSQDWTEEDDLANRQIGLRLGTGMYTFWGGELKNPRPRLGFQAGMFWYGPKAEKRLNWQTGLEVSLAGGNFKNKDSLSGQVSSSNYTAITLVQLDVPLLCDIRLRKYEKKKYETIQVGLLPGAILRSVVYVGSEHSPINQSDYTHTWKNLPLQPVNLMGVVGYQYVGGQSGINIRFRMSILNMNKNFYIPELKPATGTGKRIGTAALEVGFLF